MTQRILIIEDDMALQQMLALHFEDQGCQVTTAGTCRDGLAASEDHLDLVLLDQQLPDGEGIDLLPELVAAPTVSSVVMMTGQHDLELAISAIKAGAADFIHKPIKTATLQATVDKVLAAQIDNADDAPALSAPPAGNLIGRSAAMLEVSKQIALSAANAATVLITGESGTGKEVVARLIHEHSGRRGPFVAINCAAIVETLLESELFGHEKGAFTGADRSKTGRFELATDGTLFLDEIGELAPPMQAKLLRVLQERVVERVGGSASIAVNARIIAATHRDLFARARAGQFREDLAYRLSVIGIEVPPLRERPEDIPLLAASLIERAARLNGRDPPVLTAAALDRLRQHSWPGNVRELDNVLTQALVLARGGTIDEQHLRFRGSSEAGEGEKLPAASPADDTELVSLETLEARHIQRVLDHTDGHKGRSCSILGISRPALDRKIQKYGLTVPEKNSPR